MSAAKRNAATLGLLVLAAILALGSPATASEPVRALFLGNSYTASLGGIPELIELMAAAGGEGSLDSERITPNGFTLEGHFGDSAGSRSRIAAESWDWVALQEQSLRPIEDRPAFERFGRLLGAEIESAGARTLLFLTWARESLPETQAALTDATCDLADEIGAEVAPVGIAWELSLATRPDLSLHIFDGSHPNARGVYLAAAVIFRVLYGRSPVGLPHDLSPAVSVSAEDAAHLQATAEGVFSGGGSQPPRGACAYTADQRMLLQGDRFRATLNWRDFFGGEGQGAAVELTDDGGFFWFFDPENPEVVLKVLDGRPVNGYFWVFYGALSNVEYTLSIQDQITGELQTYFNPSGNLASFADTRAFRDGP